MTVARNWSNDWLAENSQRSYPLMDGSSSLDISGSFSIPTTFLLDLCLPTPASANFNPSLFSIINIGSYSSGYIVTVGYNGQEIGAAMVARSSHTWGKIYTITGSNQLDGFIGRVAIGNLADINAQPAGAWTFPVANAAIQPRCIIPVRTGLMGIQVKSGGVLSNVLRGIVTLVAGANARLRVVGQAIYVDAVGNADYTTQECVNQPSPGVPILTINGISPVDGDWTLANGDCSSFTAISGGLRLDNTCSKPCCGCEELAVVNSALQAVQDQYATLSAYSNRLAAAVDNVNGKL